MSLYRPTWFNMNRTIEVKEHAVMRSWHEAMTTTVMSISCLYLF